MAKQNTETETQEQFIQMMDESSEIGIGAESKKPILRNVVLLGNESRDAEGNVRRIYLSKALKNGTRHFESVKVYDEHEAAGPGQKPRKIRDILAIVHKPRYSAQENKIRGNVHIVEAGEMAKHIMWLAENEPSAIGISPNILAAYEMRNGIPNVTKIMKVKSADLVAEPATNTGLHESKHDHEHEPERGDDMDWNDLTVEGLREHRPDIHTAILAESAAQGELTKLRGEKAVLEQKIAQREEADKKAAIAAMTESLPAKIAESVHAFAAMNGVKETQDFVATLRESLPASTPRSAEKQEPTSKKPGDDAAVASAIAGYLS